MYLYTCFADPASGFDDEENGLGDFNRNESVGVLLCLTIKNFMMDSNIAGSHGDRYLQWK